MIAKRNGLMGRPVEFLFGGPHTSQPSFQRAGVAVSDVVYPIFVQGGQIHILARVVTRAILSVEEFVASRPDLYPTDRIWHSPFQKLDMAVETHPWLRAFCWTCSDHVAVAEHSTPLAHDMILPVEFLQRMTYRSKKAERPLKGVVDGKLTSINAVQGVYRLADSTVSDFDGLFQQ